MYRIYALIDVRDHSVRYVGMSKNEFSRLGQHLLDEGKPTPKGAWLAELRQLGLYPKLEVLETVRATENAYEVACEREHYWIQKFRGEGASLVNSDSFGRAILSRERLYQHRRDLGWSQNELARRARLNPNTVRKAENGEPISGQTATAIAEAFSEAFGKRILVRDIEGLNVTI